MDNLVVLKMVPDIVEELALTSDGKALDRDQARMILNEPDDQALEEALILKERYGGRVTVLAPDAPEADEALFAALAKGADRAVKVTGAGEGLGTRQTAAVLGEVLEREQSLKQSDLILTGVQAIDDLDGLLAPFLAHQLGLPFLGIVIEISMDGSERKASVTKECPAGFKARFEVDLPAILGILSAERAPRYVSVSKVRAAMKSETIELLAAPPTEAAAPSAPEMLEMKKPEVAAQAEFLEGSPEEVSGKLCEILADRSLM